MKKTIKSIIQTKEYQQLKRLILGYLWGIIKLRVQNYFNKEQGWVVDVPDDRDILAEEIVMGDVPKEVNFDKLSKIQDQRKSNVLPWASCWPHSVSHGIEVNDVINPMSWQEIARLMVQEGLLHTWGSWLIDNPKFALKQGWISGFYRVTTVEQMKAHLATGQAILVWSDKLHFNFNTDTQRYEYMRSNRSGHLWCMLPKYNEEGVWCADSLVLYWKEKFLYWKDIDFLFPSRIALTTDKRFLTIQEIKKETQEFIRETRKQGVKEQTARIKLYKWLIKKYKDKKIVLVGMRLWLGMNVTDDMLK